jgi:hypothetical protein
MTRIVPVVEVSQHRNALGIGGPDGEIGSLDIVDASGMGAELFVQSKVTAFVKQIDVVIA